MRKLKLQVQMSVDGYISGTTGGNEWMIRNWDSEIKKYIFNLTRPVDCIILGRNLAEGFIPAWHRMNEASPDAYARKMVETPKIVFSKTLENITWRNTILAKGNLTEEIIRLKQKKGRDIIAYGGVSFLSSLIKTGLVDEYNLFVNPVILGQGRSMFTDIANVISLDLVYSTSFECGITALCYVPRKEKEDPVQMKLTMDSQSNRGLRD